MAHRLVLLGIRRADDRDLGVIVAQKAQRFELHGPRQPLPAIGGDRAGVVREAKCRTVRDAQLRKRPDLAVSPDRDGHPHLPVAQGEGLLRRPDGRGRPGRELEIVGGGRVVHRRAGCDECREVLVGHPTEPRCERPTVGQGRRRQLRGLQVEQSAHDALSVGEPEPRSERSACGRRMVAVERLHVVLAAALEHAVEQRTADAPPAHPRKHVDVDERGRRAVNVEPSHPAVREPVTARVTRRLMTEERDHLGGRPHRLTRRLLVPGPPLDRSELRQHFVRSSSRVDFLDARAQCLERPLRPRARALR